MYKMYSIQLQFDRMKISHEFHDSAMKVLIFFIFVTIVSIVSSQDTPCKWTSAQWTSFKQCVGTQTNASIAKCLQQQTSTKDWNTIKNTICSNQSKSNAVTFLYYSDKHRSKLIFIFTFYR